MNRSRTVGALPAGPCGPTGSSGITVAFTTLSLSPGHVIHVFLTRSPLTYPPVTRWVGPFDLHALATPPAFVLSQDQTLQFFSFPSVPTKSRRSDTTKGFHSCVHENERSRPADPLAGIRGADVHFARIARRLLTAPKRAYIARHPKDAVTGDVTFSRRQTCSLVKEPCR